MDKAILDRFIDVYQTLNKDNLQLLNEIYHTDISITFKSANATLSSKKLLAYQLSLPR